MPARSALALGLPDPDHVAPLPESPGTATPWIGITRIAPQEARAEQVLGTTLDIQTAPVQ